MVWLFVWVAFGLALIGLDWIGFVLFCLVVFYFVCLFYFVWLCSGLFVLFCLVVFWFVCFVLFGCFRLLSFVCCLLLVAAVADVAAVAAAAAAVAVAVAQVHDAVFLFFLETRNIETKSLSIKEAF